MSDRQDFKNYLKQGVCVLSFFIMMAYVPHLFASEIESTSSEDNKAEQKNSLNKFDVGGEMATHMGNNLENTKEKLFPTVWCSDIEDISTQSSCWEAYRNGLEYFKFGLAHREEVLKWQHTSTQIILYVVLTLVAMGLYFAWVQFQSGTGGQTDTEIEISTQRLKVSSPVLGVIILVVSLAFFYLYLIYVYPIEEVI